MPSSDPVSPLWELYDDDDYGHKKMTIILLFGRLADPGMEGHAEGKMMCW